MGRSVHILSELVRLALIMTVLFIVYDSRGQNVEEISQQEPVRFTGTLAANLTFFDAQGRPSNREKFSWYVTGNPTLEVYGITLPFSFTVSEQQRDFRQPFNQFGVSPYYKWIKAHVGYRNIVFSPFTLGGHTIAGAGVELTPGKLRFGVMYGRLFKAIQAIGNPDGSFVSTPSFRRTGGALKIGYGTEQNFVDLIVLSARDDPGSINYSGSENDITPAENLVAGVYTKQIFLKNFQLEFEFAQSLYTHNTDLTDPDTLEGGAMTKPFSFLLDGANISTSHSNALEGSLGYGKEDFNIKVRYKEIGPEYQSMGAYFFQNDVRNITIEPSFRFLKSALQVNGSFGLQTDNLDNRRASTTKRKIGFLVLNGKLGKHYTGNLSYSNYDIGQAPGIVELDTLIEVSQTTQSWGMMHNVLFQGASLTHNLMLSYNYQTLNDRNPGTAVYTDYNTSNWLGSYLVTVLSLKMTVTGSYTSTIFELPSKQTKITGPTLGLTKTLASNMLSINLTYSSLAYTIDEEKHQTINRLMANASYRVARKHRLSLRFYVNQSAGEAENAEPFRETKGDIGYAYTF